MGCVVGALLSLAVRLVLNQSGIMLPPPPGGTLGSPLYVELSGAAYAAGALAMGGYLAAAILLATSLQR